MLMAKYSVKCCKGKKAFIKTQKCCSIDTGFISSSYCLAIHTTGALWHFGKRALKARHIKACIFKKLFTFHIGLHLCFVMAKAKGWNSTDHQVQGFFSGSINIMWWWKRTVHAALYVKHQHFHEEIPRVYRRLITAIGLCTGEIFVRALVESIESDVKHMTSGCKQNTKGLSPMCQTNCYWRDRKLPQWLGLLWDRPYWHTYCALMMSHIHEYILIIFVVKKDCWKKTTLKKKHNNSLDLLKELLHLVELCQMQVIKRQFKCKKKKKMYEVKFSL